MDQVTKRAHSEIKADAYGLKKDLGYFSVDYPSSVHRQREVLLMT